MMDTKELALAKVGIEALVDEVTGYQKERFKDKKMVKEICKTLKDEEIGCYEEIEGGKIDKMEFESCRKVLIIAII